MKSILKYFVEPTCINNYNDAGYAVFERLNGGVRKLAVFYGSETSKGDAELFAKAKLSGLRSFPNGFENWHETHYQAVVMIERALDKCETGEENIAILTQNDNGMGALWELAVELTDEFEALYENHEWDGDWFDTLYDFLEKKLYSQVK